ncbi:amidohydrolase [Cryobacterium adonitolivorans]|uniref:Amidohydrolase n=1 Tax=Cryobacterium adonitolivorans TaxID=1259189 RepID=A0A4R8W3M3_9MICO|nr:amidohydrolase family protein [Cryobacterium adonitolivorans]TFC01069.1 amidohydrolase [Cryobacterium adonitolivorans]
MKIIALEEHMLPRDVMQSAGVDLGDRAGKRAAELDDLGAARLAVMDDAGVDIQVLSALSYFVQGLEPEGSISVHRELNDRMAHTVVTYPDRFRAFAALPMTDTSAAVDELTRCVDELGFLGAMIHGQTSNIFLDHPSVRPILAAAVRLDVPIYLHPAPAPAVVQEAYFSGLAPEVEACLSTSGWGWHAECGMHVLRMVAAGVFEELPDLKIIVGHMGEGLPFHLDRIESMLSPVITGQSLTVAETLRRNLYLTTSGYNSDAPLLCALAAFGVDRVLFSIDYPFGNSKQATSYLASAPVSDVERQQIAHGNAESLLRIGAA